MSETRVWDPTQKKDTVEEAVASGKSAIVREREVMADLEHPHVLSIPNHTGDDRIMWDPRDKASVKVAEAAFDAAKANGMIAYEVNTETGEATREVVTRFKKNLGKVIFKTQNAGG